MKFFVYFLRCTDSSLYCGYTTNLRRRLAAHNKGAASKYTRSRLPVKLVYKETHRTLSSALQREHALKQLAKKEKELLIKKGGANKKRTGK